MRTALLVIALVSASAARAQQIWPAPQRPAIPAGAGYRPIPDVAEPVDPTRSYRVLFDATKGAENPATSCPC